ncbi:MAG: T9SS type A sorting domain-containing protein [Cryomorphaceae bacterium]
MKKILLLSFTFCFILGYSQNNPINFEPDGFGADWTWATFEAPEGEDNPEFSVVANIATDGINSSDNVAKMDISYPSTESWGQAGCESMHGSDIGTFSITDDNNIVRIMIYQEGFASPVALKFATPDGAAYFEQIAPNDVADEWVEVEFDMSEWIGDALGQPDQIIFFPSYGPRESGHVVYFDNVVFSDGETIGVEELRAEGIEVFPNPSTDFWNVQSENQSIEQVQVFNNLGQVVWSATPNATTARIDASQLAQGLYITQLKTANGFRTIKLIKE